MTTTDAQILIVGAGPAGCNAATMAASMGMNSLLIDPAATPGGTLWRIGNLTNFPGCSDGPSYAQVLREALARIDGYCTHVRATVVRIEAAEDHVRAVLADGTSLVGELLIASTGTRPAKAHEVGWITCNHDFPTLTSSTPDDLGARTVVLGGDRPLGTWLRTHPEAGQKLTVCHTAGEAYKVDEVRHDERVKLLQVRRVTVTGDGPFEVLFVLADGTHEVAEADSVLANVGNVASSIPGLGVDPDGFCPPAAQHPRVLTAGDLTARVGQRVATAVGAGAGAPLALQARFRRQAV
ncbi:FAD-dependent oxidoreductase [Kitasatospora sp. NPDC088548]|uniref:FAD-dependent oxidoreductase n=1 Tax=Kitasatospora sp. NPDC088548 TaxID=3364075 RepID=UPI00382B20E4